MIIHLLEQNFFVFLSVVLAIQELVKIYNRLPLVSDNSFFLNICCTKTIVSYQIYSFLYKVNTIVVRFEVVGSTKVEKCVYNYIYLTWGQRVKLVYNPNVLASLTQIPNFFKL